MTRPPGEQLAQAEPAFTPGPHATDYQLAVGGRSILRSRGRPRYGGDDVSATIGLL